MPSASKRYLRTEVQPRDQLRYNAWLQQLKKFDLSNQCRRDFINHMATKEGIQYDTANGFMRKYRPVFEAAVPAFAALGNQSARRTYAQKRQRKESQAGGAETAVGGEESTALLGEGSTSFQPSQVPQARSYSESAGDEKEEDSDASTDDIALPDRESDSDGSEKGSALHGARHLVQLRRWYVDSATPSTAGDARRVDVGESETPSIKRSTTTPARLWLASTPHASGSRAAAVALAMASDSSPHPGRPAKRSRSTPSAPLQNDSNTPLPGSHRATPSRIQPTPSPTPLPTPHTAAEAHAPFPIPEDDGRTSSSPVLNADVQLQRLRHELEVSMIRCRELEARVAALERDMDFKNGELEAKDREIAVKDGSLRDKSRIIELLEQRMELLDRFAGR